MQTIIIADDHPVTLNGVKLFVENLGYTVLETCNNGIYAFNKISVLQPDYAILDLSMPGYSGLEILEKIRNKNKNIKIIIYTMYHENSLYKKAVSLGVNGYLLKDFALEELETCLSELKYKNFWISAKLKDNLSLNNNDFAHQKLLLLTNAEKKIIALIAKNYTTKIIAELLFISEKTVEAHRSKIIKKLNLPNTKSALILWASENKNILEHIL